MAKRFIAVFLSLFLCFQITIYNADASAPYQDAEAFVVINAATLTVLEGKDIHKRLPMASTTKIMTAIVMCELVDDMSKTIVTTKEMVTVEGSSMGLLPGDTVSYHDLLYGLLLASGNDAANTIAISLCGSLDAFVEKMNIKAEELMLEDTSFETPSGLDGENHYTCAYDLACIAAYALKIPAIAEAVSTQRATLFYGNPPYRRSITNHNKLIGNYDGAIGVKTGFTVKSGRCLVSAVKRGECCVITVTLNAANDYDNHKYLTENNIKKLTDTKIAPDEKLCSWLVDGTEIPVSTEQPIIGLLPEEIDKISYKIYLPRFLYIPLNKGQRVGWIEYFYDSRMIARADILSDISADAPPAKEKDAGERIMDVFIKMLKF